MKKAIIYSAALAALLACASCAKKAAISGHLDGLSGDSLKVEFFDITGGREPVASFVIPAAGGDFILDYVDTVARRVRIAEAGQTEAGPSSLVYVPGENAVISGRLDSLVVDGSNFFKEQKAYEALCKDDVDRMSAIVNEYREAAAAGLEEKADSIRGLYDEVAGHITELTKGFVKDNPASLYSAMLVSRLIGEDGKDALEALEAMPEKVRNGVLKPLIDRTAKNAEKAKARAEAAEKVKDGMQAPDFTLKNPAGEDFTLSSIYDKGQYIILDFWGKWCYWCVKGIPDMKQLYKDAKGKIEIVSVDCRDTEEVWKAAIDEYELPWLHVYNPGEPTDLAITYAIQGYPTKIILNPDGTINRTIVGEDPEFYTYVRDLIKK